MLVVQPGRRLTATQLLHHPWFRLCEAVEMTHRLNLSTQSESTTPDQQQQQQQSQQHSREQQQSANDNDDK